MLAPDFSALSNAVLQLSNHSFAIARAKLIHIGKQNCSGIERTVEILQHCSPPRRARGELNLKLAEPMLLQARLQLAAQSAVMSEALAKAESNGKRAPVDRATGARPIVIQAV